MKKYQLLNKKGFYDSDTPGTFGGYKPDKIYGRLDCPSALRWIAKGHYVKHRVFFATEQDAIDCGYSPCKICMKEKKDDTK
jgi:methylphosphotriester-DNA--protein-cysteine methyltransferase